MTTILAWFEKQVQKNADVTAVILDNQSLTYDTLNRQANTLAAQLQHLTIKPNTPIALCMPRSLEQIITILAILKIGCGYVPLDPTQPAERLKRILGDANVSALIISSNQKELFDFFKGTLFVFDNKKTSSQNTVLSSITPHHLAYVIYTSGSTGSPKGVMIEHHSVVDYCQWFASYTTGCNTQRIDWSGNYIFDMAVTTSLVPLMLGLTIVMCSDEIKKNPHAYLLYLKQHEINLIKISPSYFKELVREASEHPVDLPHLQTIILGGERLLTADCQAWLALYPKQTLFNEYGPTEATVAVTQQKIGQANLHTFDTYVPIGHSGASMACYILNNNNEPVLPGQTGELYIGGTCLARGYLNQPELTEKKFISYSFNAQSIERLYKTGDSCRQLENGAIECLGRMDQQIKIRGFRIEPGEIEMCLRQHPAVKDVVVISYDDEVQGPRLVAYFIQNKNQLKPNHTQLRKHLQQHVPDYMIPNAFISLEHFPLTANTKLDVHSLPPATLSENQNYIPPRSSLQKTLVDIWSKELGFHLIGINDNFFELGGHSLNAARIVTEINRSLKKNLTLTDFYRAETIASLELLLLNATEVLSVTEEPKPTSSLGKKMPLGDFQLLLWIIKTFQPSARKLNIVSRKRWHSHLDKKALTAAFDAIFKRHAMLSAHTKTFYPALLQTSHPHFIMDETSLFDHTSEAAERLLLSSLNELINFNAWSKQSNRIIIRAFYLPDGEMELQFCLDHLVSDHVSIDIIWRDLSKFYQTNTTDTELYVEHTRSFNDYIAQEKRMIGMNFEQNRVFWENYLKTTRFFSFPLEKVVNKIKKKGLPYSTYQEIPQELLNHLDDYCSIHHLSLSAVLSAGVGLALENIVPFEQNNGRPIIMNIVKSTRNDPAWDETIGCFLRVDPIKVEINNKSTLLSIAKQVHRTTVENMAQMQASTILKFAYINAINIKKTRVRLISFAVNVYSKILRFLNLDYKALQLIGQLSWFDQKNEFIICINLRNDFNHSIKKMGALTWSDQEEKSISMYQYDQVNLDNVFDVSFLRSDDQSIPYVVISSNLKPDYRQHIALEIVRVLTAGCHEKTEGQHSAEKHTSTTESVMAKNIVESATSD